MITQHYKLPITIEVIKYARSGQYVYENNESDNVVGFVDFVSDKEICILFFKPRVINVEGAVNIATSCSYVLDRLDAIIKENPEMDNLWE